jgi:predicted site-specific integrase-resolvase
MTLDSIAALYERVSTGGQEAEGTSLDTQEAACRAHAAERGYQVAEEHIYREVHTGAEMWERPKLTALREAVRQGRVGAVICYALDRLSRKQAHVSIIADECERAGVPLLFVTEEFERSPVGEFIRNAKAFAAELERERSRSAPSAAGRLSSSPGSCTTPALTSTAIARTARRGSDRSTSLRPPWSGSCTAGWSRRGGLSAGSRVPSMTGVSPRPRRARSLSRTGARPAGDGPKSTVC